MTDEDQETDGRGTSTQHRQSGRGHSSANGDDLDEIYTQLADSVAVLSTTRLAARAAGGATDSSLISAPGSKEDGDEPDAEPGAAQEAQDGIDDPVRMYLREIGK